MRSVFLPLVLFVSIAGPGCAGMERCKRVVGTSRCLSPGDDLRCTMVAESVVKAGEPVNVRFTLTNTTRSKIFHLMIRDTPLTGPLLDGDHFIVRRGGGRLPYQGVFADWFPGRCERMPCDMYLEYQTLRPGMSLSQTVDLRNDYAITQPGQYHISYWGGVVELVTGSKPPYHGPNRTRPPRRLRPGVIDCNAVTITVEPR